ncbi:MULTISPECIES: hypothetical protein [Halorussus]|uniref:hypothetical protein n=1 Tax=Halorussus TaxID=1070314 RepID=UPI0020A0B2F3|nr:hypothetical protein [Halorussus vallis]USZ78194.1 hypothetical protein NGM07_21290 [Halorussus vallis]
MDTLKNLGFGALAAGLLTAEDVAAAGPDQVPIVYGLTRDGAGDGGTAGDAGALRPRRQTVPADWYDDFRSAVAAHRRLDVTGRDGVASSAVAPGEFGGRNSRIQVQITDENARGVLPEAIDRVPVDVTHVGPADATPPESAAPGGSVSVRTGVPGGVGIASEDLYGTLAPAMRDPSDGSAYFATANHVFGGRNNGGRPLFLVDDGKTEIGAVRESYPKEDFVCVRPKAGFRPVHRIHADSSRRVVGQFTRDGLASLKAAGEPLEKIGVRSGHTKGKIQAVDGITCAYGAICKRGQLKWGSESDFTDGDSGSVNYHADPENPDRGVLVGGFNNARTWWPGENYVWGTGAYRITERHGYTF